MKIRKGTN